MKTMYKWLVLLLFICSASSMYAQISILDAVAIDGNSDGYYGTIELKFSTNIDDSEFEQSVITDDEWIFSLDPFFSDTLYPDNFNSNVGYIDGGVSGNNDEYVQIVFDINSQFAGSSGPVYMRYTNSNADVITEQGGTNDTLFSFSLYSARDVAPPEIESVTSNANIEDTLVVGETITFTVDLKDTIPDPNLTIYPLQYNGRNLNWGTFNNGDTYVGTYTVTEGDDDKFPPLQLTGVYAEDAEGNVSASTFDGNDVDKAIDANSPVINTVYSDKNTADTLILTESITFTVDIVTDDPDLDISPKTYNSQTITWSTDDGGSTYEATYTVDPADPDQPTPLQLTEVVAKDPAGNESNRFDGNDVAVAIDASKPAIVDITSDASVAGVLKVGDKITFTIDVAPPAEGSLIINSIPSGYNGQALNWNTSNGGDTYQAIYTVSEGDPDQDTPLDLLGVTLTDQAGNVSDPDDGNVAKTIDANSPVINSVIVPQVKMIYGQTYTITIEVSNDNSDTWSLVSGKIAGFNITNLQKQDLNTYEADFTVGNLGYDVQDGDSYDIENLVVADPAGNHSDPYTNTIAQSGDPIYTIEPTAKVKGKHHICDEDSATLSFQLTGNSPWEVKLYDGSGTTTISNITESPFQYKVEALDLNGTVDPDTTVYKITEVTDVNLITTSMPGTDSAMVFAYKLPTVEITDPAGDKTYNIGASADTLVGNPVGGVFSGDGIVSSNNTFLASSAGIGSHKISYTYTEPSSGCWGSDTVVFDVIQSNANIAFDNGDDDWRCDYELSMVVTAEVITDPGKIGTLSLSPNPGALVATGINQAQIDITQLSAGTYQVKFEYDEGGPISVTRSFTVESVSSAIDITDIVDQCEDYDTIRVAAFNLTPVGGSGAFFFTGSTDDFNVYDPNGNQMYFYPDSVDPGSYQLKYVYTTPNGCVGDTVRKYFDVNPLPNVGITMNSVYNIDQGESTITGIPTDAGGEFYPAFMNDNNDGTALFDPADAGLGIYWVKYIYEDTKGCVNVDSTQIEVNQALGEINSSSGSFQFCYYGASTVTFTGTPDPTDGSPGSFYIDDVFITPISDNVISFNPQDYTAGEHQVRFEYSNGGTDYQVFETLDIDSIGTIYYTGLEDAYCESEDIEVELTAFYPGLDGSITFTGNGVTDIVADNLGYFNPSDANLGDNVVNYIFTRDYSGCQKSYNKSVTVNKTPIVAFSPDEKCIVGTNYPLRFTADTLTSDSIVSWDWTFRTVNKSFSPEPSFNPVPGYNSMRLKLTTNKGCSNEVDSVFYIGTRVDLDFSFENECHGETVLFELLNTSDPQDTISTGWNFGGSGIVDLSDKEKPTFQYDNPGAYDVIYEEVLKSCGRIADTLRLNIRPSIDLSTGGYTESFEDQPSVTGWVIEDFEEGANNTWQWGEPTGAKIHTAASGSKIFATNLSGNYENDEKGMVTSPCFDFSQVERPMMKMNFISYTETDRDGVVMQYTKPNGDWTTIGVPSDGISWYNSYIISGSPANQQLGWTGEIIDSENNEWNTAMFRLDELRGRAGVRFRIVFGSNGDFTNEGFAFDNMEFRERERLVLLENFTNIYDDDANQSQDRYIDPILQKDSLDLISLNYHTSFPNANGFNAYYPSGPSARTLYYGVAAVPYSVVDGERQFDYSPGNELSESDIHKRVLIDESFSIALKQDVQNNKLVISASVKALKDISNRDLVAYIAVVEKTVELDSEIYHNVLRTMLPDAAGYLIERDWLENDSVKIYQTWSIPNDINVDSLLTIVFVQDDETKEVYQTTYTDKFSTITSIEEINASVISHDFRVYPNPVKEMLTLEILKNVSSNMQVKMYNGVGALVKSGVLKRDVERLEINTSDLPGGVYYIRITSADKLIDTRKVIKVE